MEPKFQSSFIPKTQVASNYSSANNARGGVRTRSITGFLGVTIFTLAIILALGLIGYKYYLNYHIRQMGADLETARATIDPKAISELTKLSNRIVATGELIHNHRLISPLFDFLEKETAKSVRFSEFSYTSDGGLLVLELRGEAKGYEALALQSNIFNASSYFVNPIFSNLNLNEKGNVTFSFKATVNPDMLSYEKSKEQAVVPVEVFAPASTTATTTTPN